VIKSAEDFLRGPEIFADGGAAAAAAIRKERAQYPDTVLHSPSDIEGVPPMIKAGPEPSLNRLVLLKRLIYFAMGRSVHSTGIIPAADAAWWHTSQFDSVVVTDASQEGVRFRKRDRAMTVALAKRAARAFRAVASETPRLRGEYRAAVPEVTSRENWQRATTEVQTLFSLLEAAISDYTPDLVRQGVRVALLGRLEEVSGSTRASIEEALHTTRGGTAMTLNVAFNYSGRCEIVDAARHLTRVAVTAGEVLRRRRRAVRERGPASHVDGRH
jgi:hypothetical protein